MNSMEDLFSIPDDVVAHILHFVLQGNGFLSCLESNSPYSVLSRVCKRWNKLLTERTQFQYFRLSAISKDELLKLAEASQEAEIYDDMFKFITRALLWGTSTTERERHLFAVARNGVLGIRRASLRVLRSQLDKLIDKPQNSMQLRICTAYIAKLEAELEERINLVIRTFQHCLKHETNDIVKLSIYKLMADNYRYKLEFSKDPNLREFVNDQYAYCQNFCLNTSIPVTNPTRLGVALNYCVFLCEMMNQSTRAVEVAKQAFDSALEHLDELSEQEYKDATLIMQLLRDNMSLWEPQET